MGTVGYVYIFTSLYLNSSNCDMSRARSKTVDTAEVKKNGLPRRLNEKIALMKKKELAQSQAFEQAMQSIFEVSNANNK